MWKILGALKSVTEERGAEFLDVLMDGRMIDIGEAEEVGG